MISVASVDVIAHVRPDTKIRTRSHPESATGPFVAVEVVGDDGSRVALLVHDEVTIERLGDAVARAHAELVAAIVKKVAA